ncbi:MAG: hypothetical protein WCS37_07125 [Chloroflexota bacterium]
MNQAGDSHNSSSIDKVITLARSGNRAGAYSLVLELVKQQPDDILSLLWLAYTSDKVEEVEVVLHRVLSLDPHNQRALEWQTLIRQKQQRLRAGQTGPLPPTPPVTISSKHLTVKPTLSNSSPEPESRSYPLPVQPSVSVSSTPASYYAEPQPLATWTAPQPTYQVTIESGSSSSPTLPYAQALPSLSSAKRRWWLSVLAASLLIVALLALVVVLINPANSKLVLANYRLFNSLDELMKDGFVDQRVAIQTRFMGGLTKDADGTYLLILSDGKSSLYVQWNENTTPVNNFRPGQFITIYGRLSGVNGGKGTLKVDKVEAIT